MKWFRIGTQGGTNRVIFLAGDLCSPRVYLAGGGHRPFVYLSLKLFGRRIRLFTNSPFWMYGKA